MACSNIAWQFIKIFRIRKLLQNISFFVVLNFGIKLVWLWIDVRVHDIAGSETFGRYAGLVSMVTILSVFYDLGINHFSSRNISKDNTNFNKLFPSLLVLRLSVLVLFPMLLTGICYLLGFPRTELKWLFIIALSHNLFQCALFFRAKLQAFQRFKLDSFASVSQRFLMIAVVGGMIFFFVHRYPNFLELLKQISDKTEILDVYISIELISHAVVFVLLFILVVALFGWVKFRFDRNSVKNVILGSMPFAVMTLLYSLNWQIDMVMLGPLHSDEEAGIYKAAVRMYEAGMMYPWILMPMFFAKFASYNNDPQKVKDLLRVGTLVMFIPMLILGSIFIFSPEPLFFFFKDHSNVDVSKMELLMGILGGSFIAHGISVVYGTYLNSSGFVKNVNWMVALSVGVNVLLNAMLIPTLGAVAAAWSTTISTIILFLSYLYLLKRKAGISPNVKLLLRLLSLMGLVFGMMIGVLQLELTWYYNWVTIIFGTALFALLLGLFRKEMYVLNE